MPKTYQWVGQTQDELVFETQASAGRCRTGAIRGEAGASAREFHLSRDWPLLVYAAISNESRSLSETGIMRYPIAGPTSNTSPVTGRRAGRGRSCCDLDLLAATFAPKRVEGTVAGGCGEPYALDHNRTPRADNRIR